MPIAKLSNILAAQSSIGYTGSQGSIGFTGSKGYDGSIGFTGSTGFTGSRGTLGFAGSIGYTGSQGDIGYTGSTGFIGSFGYTGSQGNIGYTGSRGDIGYTGSTGFIGSFGYTGSQGNIGYTGSRGDIGYTGSLGSTGGVTYSVTSSGSSSYTIAGSSNPTLTLIKGFTYYFSVSAAGHPFWIKTSQTTGTGDAYNTGVTNNGTDSGTVTFTVPFDSPATLYYICQFHGAMTGVLSVVDTMHGYTGSQGIGYTGSQGIGYTGSKGDTGLGFTIAKSYANVAALTADTSPTSIVAGQFAIIETGNVEDAENSRLYLWNGSVYSYVNDLSGAAGITGPQGNTGYVGSKGDAGYIGSKGDAGYVGSQGLIGYTGSAGTGGSGGTLQPWTLQTANYSASNSDRIIANTSAGSFTITLPAAPTVGHYVQITDGYNLSANNVVVAPNGSTIEGYSDTLLLDIPNTTYELIYSGSTWQLTATAGPTGFVGSRGSLGYTGSQGVGYTGSEGQQGPIGYTGSTPAGSINTGKAIAMAMVFGG